MDDSNFIPNAVETGSPAGAHSEGIRLHKNRSSSIYNTALFHWVKKRLPSVGAGNFAWSSYGLVELSPIGPSVAARNLYHTIAAQTYVNAQAVNTTGVGGLAAGQYISQPLIDEQNDTYGGVPV